MKDKIEKSDHITTDDQGYDQHPAWGVIGVGRVQGSSAALFDSEIQHQHYMVLRIRQARRKRDLNRDWIHGDIRPIIEVAMSEAQWAAFVSSAGKGDGTPCTIQFANGERTPELPHDPRLAESLEEVREAGNKAIEKIREAFKKVEEKPNKGNIRNLGIMIGHLPANMHFAAESLAEAAEEVVTKARADIEAFAQSAAERRGLEPGELSETHLLDEGSEDK